MLTQRRPKTLLLVKIGICLILNTDNMYTKFPETLWLVLELTWPARDNAEYKCDGGWTRPSNAADLLCGK